MVQKFNNDQICGGVAAQGYIETLANELDNAFAQGESFERGIDDIQVWFDFTLVGEPECPDKISVETNDFIHERYEIANDEGLSVWGLCCKAADWFPRILAEDFDYNIICQ